MAFQQKEWKNRLSENPTRRLLTPVDGSTPFQVDVTRAEGTIMQAGDPFNADNMNDLEARIAAGIGGGDENMAPIEEGPESANPYVVGDLLIYDGQLYKVTDAIAIGNSLVEGINIEATTLSDEIIDFRDEIIGEFTANGNRFYFDYHDGKYGYNTSPTRGADTFNPFSSGPVNSNWVRVDSTTISVAGSHLITLSNGWIDRVNWTTQQKITVNGSDIPIFWQPLMGGSRDQGGVEQYYRAMVTVTFANLNVGDVVQGYKRGQYDSGYVAATPTIWRYEP